MHTFNVLYAFQLFSPVPGPERQARLRRINALAHSYGILMGADIPIANAQQHGWKMISLHDTYEKQVRGDC